MSEIPAAAIGQDVFGRTILRVESGFGLRTYHACDVVDGVPTPTGVAITHTSDTAVMNALNAMAPSGWAPPVDEVVPP